MLISLHGHFTSQFVFISSLSILTFLSRLWPLDESNYLDFGCCLLLIAEGDDVIALYGSDNKNALSGRVSATSEIKKADHDNLINADWRQRQPLSPLIAGDISPRHSLQTDDMQIGEDPSFVASGPNENSTHTFCSVYRLRAWPLYSSVSVALEEMRKTQSRDMGRRGAVYRIVCAFL